MKAKCSAPLPRFSIWQTWSNFDGELILYCIGREIKIFLFLEYDDIIITWFRRSRSTVEKEDGSK